MQELGNFLERLGPVFGLIFLVLVFAVGAASIGLAIPVLVQRHRHV